jgi:hypothetical protein
MSIFDESRGIGWEGVDGYHDRVRMTMPSPFGRKVRDPYTDVATAALAYSRCAGIALHLVRPDLTSVPFTPGVLANSADGAYSGVSVSLRGLAVVEKTTPNVVWDLRAHVPRLDTPGGSFIYFFVADLGSFDGHIQGVGHVRSLSKATWDEQVLIPLPPSASSGTWRRAPLQFISSIPTELLLTIRAAR